MPSVDVIATVVKHSGVGQADRASDGFVAIGRFNGNGLAQGEVPEGIGPVKAIRLHVHDKSNAWVILSEVATVVLFSSFLHQIVSYILILKLFSDSQKSVYSD